MGLAFSCYEKAPSVERIEYNMKPLKDKNLPIIWIIGQQNTGKKTHGEFIQERYDYEHISVTQLLRSEAMKDTDRGHLIRDLLNSGKKISDEIIIDLLKEALLNSTNEEGFAISNFPKNSKQAEMFVDEIGNASFILYLYSDTPFLVQRAQAKATDEISEEALKKDIAFATKDIKTALVKFEMKVENINTSHSPDEAFETIETVFSERLNLTRRIVETESDYVRPHEIEEEA